MLDFTIPTVGLPHMMAELQQKYLIKI